MILKIHQSECVIIIAQKQQRHGSFSLGAARNEIAEMSAAGIWISVCNKLARHFIPAGFCAFAAFYINLCDEMIVHCSVFYLKMFYHLHHSIKQIATLETLIIFIFSDDVL
jgi:hypothetical protein